jgi:hypothetical protein
MAEADAKPPRIFHRWMLYALAAFLVFGGAGFAIYWPYREKWERPPPKVDICFTALGNRLRRPAIVAPSEPYTIDGQTYYLTDAQVRSAGCAARLPGHLNYDMVKVWAIEDGDEQANALRQLVLDVPLDTDHDKRAFGAWRLSAGTLKSLPDTPVRNKAMQDIDEAIGCRFNHPQLPGCASRPGFPIHAGVLGGIGAAGFLAAFGGVLYGLGRRLVRWFKARRAAKRAAAASATVAP